jgi:hypothetical protein
MYITKPETVGEDRVYWCNGLVSEWLIYEKHFPLLTKKGNSYGFSKTKILEDTIEKLPFWLKVVRHL